MRQPKLIEAHNNPHYPLPADYYTLTKEGQRIARVNAQRQYLCFPLSNKSLIKQRQFAFIKGLEFFDHNYLRIQRDEDNSIIYDPYYYDVDPLPRPKFHWAFAAAYNTYKRAVGAGPRGGAKTKLFEILIMANMLAEPMYSTVYASATDDLSSRVSENIRYQLYNNELIARDFAPEPEFGGEIAPKRGASSGKSGEMMFHLTNRSVLQALSAQSRQRGLRPRKYVLDDPEYDATKSTSEELLREWMDRLLFKLIQPMLDMPGRSVAWFGTYVSKRHYLTHAMSTKVIELDNGQKLTVAADERFDRWYRLNQPGAVWDEANNRWLSSWPEKWPANEAERDALGLSPETETIEEIEKAWGSAVFNSEFLGKVDLDTSSFFPELTFETNGWNIVGDSDLTFITDPTTSNTKIRFFEEGIERIMPMHELLAQSFIFMTLDSAYTENSYSDSKVATVHAVGLRGSYHFVLDMLSTNRLPQNIFVKQALEMALRWKCRSMHPEQVREGSWLTRDLGEIIAFMKNAGATNVPAVIPLKVGMTAKADKIAPLHKHFESGRIKLPWHRLNSHPFDRLRKQINGFDPRSADCGLDHDDELDTVAMKQFVITFGPKPPLKNPDRDLVDRALDGDTHLEDGTAIGPILMQSTNPRSGVGLDAILNTTLSLPPKDKDIL